MRIVEKGQPLQRPHWKEGEENADQIRQALETARGKRLYLIQNQERKGSRASDIDSDKKRNWRP